MKPIVRVLDPLRRVVGAAGDVERPLDVRLEEEVAAVGARPIGEAAEQVVVDVRRCRRRAARRSSSRSRAGARASRRSGRRAPGRRRGRVPAARATACPSVWFVGVEPDVEVAVDSRKIVSSNVRPGRVAAGRRRTRGRPSAARCTNSVAHSAISGSSSCVNCRSACDGADAAELLDRPQRVPPDLPVAGRAGPPRRAGRWRPPRCGRRTRTAPARASPGPDGEAPGGRSSSLGRASRRTGDPVQPVPKSLAHAAGSPTTCASGVGCVSAEAYASRSTSRCSGWRTSKGADSSSPRTAWFPMI